MSLYGAAVAVVRVLAKLLFRVKVTGEKHLPEGPVVLCPNHMSYMDPVFVATSIDRRITAVAKASLFDKPFIGWLFKKLEIIPVNRDGGDFGAVRTAVKALTTFPSPLARPLLRRRQLCSLWTTTATSPSNVIEGQN